MTKRRDAKNRQLMRGEYQKSDGRYMYRYTDANGKIRYVYSWTLTQTDRAPEGRKTEKCLRELEKEINKDVQDKIDIHNAKKLTLNAFFYDYIEQKRELKTTTRRDYKYIYRTYVEETLGRRKIADIRYSDIKKFYNSLIYDSHLLPSSVDRINVVINPVFAVAVRDELIRINPASGIIAEIKKSQCWNQSQKHSLTVEEQAIFVDFLKKDETYNWWLPLFSFLLGTGCRIGEALGLTWSDCDFKSNIISINHNLVYKPDEFTNKSVFRIMTPKTEAGIREIPMLADVRQLLLDERERQFKEGFNKSNIDGYTGFIFTSKANIVHRNSNVNRALIRIVNKYNKQEEELAQKELRKPIFLPHISVHTFRHTFCTRLCENESNLKIIQKIMGHSNISTTMDVYNEATQMKKKESFANLEGKFKIC